MKRHIIIDDSWPDGLPEIDEDYIRVLPSGGTQQQAYRLAPDKSTTERAWRDSELSRTDEFVKLPDYPVDLLPYRVELRDYPAKFDFPNGDRPIV